MYGFAAPTPPFRCSAPFRSVPQAGRVFTPAVCPTWAFRVQRPRGPCGLCGEKETEWNTCSGLLPRLQHVVPAFAVHGALDGGGGFREFIKPKVSPKAVNRAELLKSLGITEEEVQAILAARVANGQ